MKKIQISTFVLLLLLAVTNINAQKVDQRLMRLVQHTTETRALPESNPQTVSQQIVADFNADGTLNTISAVAFLEKDAECPTAQLEQMGIKVRFVVGDMVGLIIPADKLVALEQVEAFRYVRADEYVKKDNEEARRASGVDQVNNETAAQAEGLPKAFTGEGVVLGIIDGGIDFNHAAFCNSNGTTRIKKAIVYKDNQLVEYADNQISSLTTDEADSHGTHTAVTAGGSDTGNGQKGVAPQADLILCGIGNMLSNVNIIDCMKKIFEYADQVGKPAVISISLGSPLGLHDGSESISQAVAELTENGTKPGRAVVMSSGNQGQRYQSIVQKLSGASDELKTVLGAYSLTQEKKPRYRAGYCLYADDYKDFSVELKVVNITTGAVEELGTHVKDTNGDPYTLKIDKNTDVPTAKGGKAVTYEMSINPTAVLDDPNLRLALFVKPGSAGQTIKMNCDGDNNNEPCFDAPTESGYDFKAAGYTKGNGDLACNKAPCNDAVIGVGSYITRTKWTDWKGETYYYPESPLTGKERVVGQISDFSGYCIDDNGKARPSLVAPGQAIFSGANNYDTSYFIEGQPGVPNEERDLADLIGSVELNGHKSWYYKYQGTSMACPHAAGIVALWMQAKPSLTVKEILEVIKETSVNDKFTTDTDQIPSGNKVQAGYGKIDCLAGLKKILGSTAIARIIADENQQVPPAQLNVVDAPVYDLKGQQVPNSQKGLVIYKGHKYVNKK
jgi:subtilisin family serine protease